MKWQGLEFHIENLVPGVVSVALLALIFDTAGDSVLPEPPEILAAGITGPLLLLATSYLLGAIAVAVSRFLLDRPSECLPRRMFILWLDRGDEKPGDGGTAEAESLAWGNVNDRYRAQIATAMRHGTDSLKVELTKRRERGRIVRTSLVPGVLAVFWLVAQMRQSAFLWLVPAVYVAVLFVYAYTEFTIWEECRLSSALGPVV